LDWFEVLLVVPHPSLRLRLAGGREELVSLLEEGLREVTNINYHVFYNT
jgi:hypothetical protein